MSFPESWEWVLEGEEAAEFVNKLFEPKEKRKLLTDTKLSSKELHKKAVENGRKFKKQTEV